MNRFVLNQAFITMGYRQATNFQPGNFYSKPVGFCIIMAEIEHNHKEVTFQSLFRSYSDSEVMTYSKRKMNIDFANEKLGYEYISEKELYDRYCKGIANTEINLNVGHAMSVGDRSEPFAFRSKYDIMSIVY